MRRGALVSPSLHYWYSEHLRWVSFDDALPKYPEFPPTDEAETP